MLSGKSLSIQEWCFSVGSCWPWAESNCSWRASPIYQCCKSEPKLDKNQVIVHFWADISKDPKACCFQALKSSPAWPESQPKGPCLVLAVSQGSSAPCTETKAGLDNSALNLSSSRSLEMDIQGRLRFLVPHSGDQNPLISRKLGAEWIQNELWFSSSALFGLQFGLDGAAQSMRRIFFHFLAYVPKVWLTGNLLVLWWHWGLISPRFILLDRFIHDLSRFIHGAWTTSTDQLLAAGVADTRKWCPGHFNSKPWQKGFFWLPLLLVWWPEVQSSPKSRGSMLARRDWTLNSPSEPPDVWDFCSLWWRSECCFHTEIFFKNILIQCHEKAPSSHRAI